MEVMNVFLSAEKLIDGEEIATPIIKDDEHHSSHAKFTGKEHEHHSSPTKFTSKEKISA
jgi:hypothetical protein